MDTTTIIAIIGGVVTAASALTNLIPTPASTAPAWLRAGYKIVELLALVGAGTKEHPDALVAIGTSIGAASRGDISTAVSQGLVAEAIISGEPVKRVAPLVVPEIIGMMMVFGVSACTATGSLTPAGQVTADVACAVDQAVHPEALAAATAAIGPAGTVLDEAAFAGVSAACQQAIQQQLAGPIAGN